MRLDEVTPDMVIEAARRVQNRKGYFTNKDVWYELSGVNKRGKFQTGEVKRISNILHQTEACFSIVRLEDTPKKAAAQYRVRKE